MTHSWKCRFGWHRWTKWAMPKEGTVQSSIFSVTDASCMVQDRACEDCGHYEIRLAQ